jgi:hypothetical protein
MQRTHLGTTATLEDWLEPIACVWRLVRNNGITEGFHRKMKLISGARMASGTSKTTACVSSINNLTSIPQ